MEKETLSQHDRDLLGSLYEMVGYCKAPTLMLHIEALLDEFSKKWPE